MRNLFFFVLVIVVGSSYYVNNKGSFDVNPASSSSSIAHPTASNFNNFRCDGRQHCSQMSSYEEAKFLLKTAQIRKWMVTMMAYLVKGNLDIDI